MKKIKIICCLTIAVFFVLSYNIVSSILYALGNQWYQDLLKPKVISNLWLMSAIRDCHFFVVITFLTWRFCNLSNLKNMLIYAYIFGGFVVWNVAFFVLKSLLLSSIVGMAMLLVCVVVFARVVRENKKALVFGLPTLLWIVFLCVNNFALYYMQG